MADLANLTFDITLLNDNIMFDWAGFNDSMPNYIQETIQRMMNMRSADLKLIFEQVKEQLL